MKSKPLLNLLRTACTPRPGTEEGDRASPSPDKSGPIRPHSAAAVPTQSAADTGRPSTEEGSELIRPGQAEPGSPSCCLLRLVFTLLFLFSRDKGERQRRRFSVVCRLDLRLWLGLVDILKYFLGAPSPELPLRINIFSKMKTVCAQTRGSVAAVDLACHVRMVSSTCSTESAWQASFFSDLRLHSFSASKLAASRILESDWKERRQSEHSFRRIRDNSENLSSCLS